MNGKNEIPHLQNLFIKEENFPPLFLTYSRGVWVRDHQGKRYLDLTSGDFCVNQGHRHPQIIASAKKQLERSAITSLSFYSEQMAILSDKLAKITNKEKISILNNEEEAFQLSFFLIHQKNPNSTSEILVIDDALPYSFFSNSYSFKSVHSNEIALLDTSLTPNTRAILFEPLLLKKETLQALRKFCDEHQLLLIANETRSGLGRTGAFFGCDWGKIVPDIYILGKSLGGGIVSLAAVAFNQNILNFNSHHNFFLENNSFSCAIGISSLDVILEENLSHHSLELGNYFLNQLMKIPYSKIKKIEGRGLFVALEFQEPADMYREYLQERGILCKCLNSNTLVLSPPLTISKTEIDFVLERIEDMFGIFDLDSIKDDFNSKLEHIETSIQNSLKESLGEYWFSKLKEGKLLVISVNPENEEFQIKFKIQNKEEKHL